MGAETMGERCARCGDVGEDRRTLWMACFYAMHELPVPFELVQVTGTVQRHIGERALEGIGVTLPMYEEPDAAAKSRPFGFYTLRVCKRCRGDWMAAIAAWFATPPAPEPDDAVDGVFVRKLGVTRRATEDEVRDMRAPRPAAPTPEGRGDGA